MLLLRFGFMVFLLTFATICHGQAQKDKTFPTNEEIDLLVTQAERAVQQYRPLVNQEEALLGKSGAESFAKDRELIHGLEVAIKALRVNPQGFNSPTGFAFFEWLDDSDRNILLCQTAAASVAGAAMIGGNAKKAQDLLHLAQSCASVEALFYTVSENAGSLYQRYVAAEYQVAKEGEALAASCTEALKKKAAEKK